MRTHMLAIGLVGLIGLTAVPAAHAVNWGVGANLGFFTFTSDDVEDFSTIGWPSTNLLPGLRVSFAGDGSPHVVYIDTELILNSASGNSTRDFSAVGGYMYVFPSTGNTAPFVTGNAGVVLTGLDVSDPVFGDFNATATSAVFGGGIGLQHRMGNGFGTVRAEARFDRLTQGEDQGVILIPEGNGFGLKLGFDLWDQGSPK